MIYFMLLILVLTIIMQGECHSFYLIFGDANFKLSHNIIMKSKNVSVLYNLLH